jgi:hypothetical protein
VTKSDVMQDIASKVVAEIGSLCAQAVVELEPRDVIRAMLSAAAILAPRAGVAQAAFLEDANVAYTHFNKEGQAVS